MKYKFKIFTLLFCVIYSANIFAATKTWDGGSVANSNWTTAENWDSDIAPSAGDALVFAGSTRTSPSNDFAAATNFASITFSVGASAFTLSGNSVTITGGATAITCNNTSNTMTISLDIIFSTSAPTITGANGGGLTISGNIDNGGLLITTDYQGNGGLVISGIISGTGGLTANSGGNLTLSGNNTYSGLTTQKVGIGLQHGNALGATSSGTLINGLSLGLILGTQTYAEPITMNSATGLMRTNANGIADIITYTGNITLAVSNTTGGFRSTDATDVITISGIISGGFDANFNPSGSGTVILSAANTFTGSATVSAGTLKLGAAGVIPDACAVTVTGTLDMNTYSETVGSIAGAGTIDNVSGGGTPTLTCGGNNSSTTFSGVIQNTSGVISLSKAGSGTLTLSGANTYTGTTTTTAGTLLLGAANRISNSSNFVAAGGTFSTGSGAGFSETMGTLTLNANTIIALGTGSHSLNFAASNGTTWTAARLLRITGWQGGFNCTSGTAGKIYTGSSVELVSGQLDQIFFTHPISALPYTACQLSDGEIVPTGTLPVELVSFDGNLVGNRVILNWVTASEINSDYFEVLRSSDGKIFESIGTMHAGSNSVDFLNYEMIDQNPQAGINYYKLVQYDFNGSYEEFNTIVIQNKVSGFTINSLFPNPSSDLLAVNFQSEEGIHFLSVLDEQGKEIYSTFLAGKKGENEFTLSVSTYANAKYILKISNLKNESIASQFVVQH